MQLYPTQIPCSTLKENCLDIFVQKFVQEIGVQIYNMVLGAFMLLAVVLNPQLWRYPC